MCGDDDDSGPSRLEELLYDRYLVHARSLLAQAERRGAGNDEIIAAIDKLFTDALARSVKDAESADDEKRYDMLSLQPLAFARLAGFLAAHLSLQEDPLRKVMEALMHGYAEAERIQPDHGHDHGDGDGFHQH
ncbi:MAG: hypothetical protein JWO28_3026 [Hyphomicrobiales bacterium]|jgi:hypothetical protein|nr:hypothetical protein [Hyphomicrobiales bacterium]